MSEMIERVARAIHASMDEGFPKFTRQRWEELSGPATDAMLLRARAAIEALREPTESMIVTCSVTGPTREVVERQKAAIRRDWTAMIDAALIDTEQQ